MYKVRYYEQTLIEVKNMKDKYEKKNKLSPEVKSSIIVIACSLLFLGSVTTIGILLNRKPKDDVIVTPVSSTTSISSSITQPSSTAEPVVSILDSTLKKPFNEEKVEIKRYFFDPSKEDNILQNAMYIEDGVYHSSKGVDYYTKSDIKFNVYAVADGVVKSITPNDKTFGNIVEIQHVGTDLTTLYASLGEIDVKVGQEVKSGEKIGTSGSSSINGDCSNSLHFEVIKNDICLNPIDLYGKQLKEI